MATPNPQPPLDAPTKEQILRLHIAEYQALMAKSTALLSLTFTMVGVAFAFLGFMIHAWPGQGNQRAEILWWTLVIEQGLIFLMLVLMHREYGIVLYIENELRKSCEGITQEKLFWKYERFLKSQHKERKVDWYSWIAWVPFSVSAGAWLGVCIYKLSVLSNQGGAMWEYFPFAIGLVVGALTGWSSHSLYLKKTRSFAPVESGS